MSDFLGKARSWLMWPWRLILVAAFVVSFAISLVALVYPDARNTAGIRTTILGMEYGPAGVQAPRWIGVAGVDPGGAAREAGLRAGDSVRFDTFLADRLRWEPGARVGMTVARGDERLRATIVARAPSQNAASAQNTRAMTATILSRLLILGFVALLVVRGYRHRRALQMAAILLGIVSAPTFIPNMPLLPLATVMLHVIATATISYLWPVFCLELSGGASNRRQARLVHGAAATLAAFSVVIVLARYELFPAFGLDADLGYAGVLAAHTILGCAVAAGNYARNDAASRNRIKIVVGAFVLLTLASLGSNLGLQVVSLAVTVWIVFSLRFFALALLAYGVLKERLFDLGFAVNRTLVYGAAAFTLLATFGLVEYAAKNAIPQAWPDAGPFISAGIAVLLFLSFHRLHLWFEHHIERLFFRKWQEAEKELKRFVHSAGHFDKSSALCKAAADAVSRYAEGAGAALYVRGSDGAFGKEAGRLEGARKSYPDDDPAFALMRGERKPIELARAHGALPGELALPMLEQGSLIGFVLLAPKPDGAHYRPDELELLSWAVHHIGLDLRALHARQLEALNSTQAQRIATLSEDKERLTVLLAGSRPQTA